MQNQQEQQQQQQGQQHQGQPSSSVFNTAPGPLAALLDTNKAYNSPARARTRPPRQSPPSTLPRRRRVSCSPSRQRHIVHEQTPPPGSSGHVPWIEQFQYAPPAEPISRPRRSYSDQRLDTRNPDHEREHRSSGRPRPLSLGRQEDSTPSRARSSGRSGQRSTPYKKRSQSLGDRMALAVVNKREPPPPSSLMLYHVSRPEPRAPWVFNLSKRTNVVDSGPPPDTITSTIDVKRPNLGGLVWINAVQGNLHCCLQKGVKNKAVTPVPAEVLDGWLNGQTGFWWIGALKEGHRALWDSHVVLNWAMVFIPSSPEVAARNNMEVWHDKCLPGSLRVARPGELARKILDIVADDQDKEPEQVVHTHLCILLAEGDDLELKRPKMFSSASPAHTPRLTSQQTPRLSAPSPAGSLKHSKSVGNLDLGGSADKDGAVAGGIRSASGDANSTAGGGAGEAPPGAGNADNIAALEEALEKVNKYRERIVILKEDRRSKKALVEQLRNELIEKEEELSAENERLRLERNDIKERATALWVDIENLRRDRAVIEAESHMSRQDAEGLKKLVDRLRRERNSARSDAMRWLEQQRTSTSPSEAPGDDANGIFPKTPGRSRGLSTRARSAPDGLVSGTDGGVGATKVAVDAKAAAAIAKLKSKVERLRRERDDAEKQAAAWLRTEQEKFARSQTDPGATASDSGGGMSSSGGSVGDENGRGDGGGVPGGGPVVASLRAEGLKLKKELQEAREEAERLRRTPSQGVVDGSWTASAGDPMRSMNGFLKNGESEAAGAQEALGRLLGQALNLLGPQGAGAADSAAASPHPPGRASRTGQPHPAATPAEVVVVAMPPPLPSAAAGKPEPPPEVIEFAPPEGTHAPTGEPRESSSKTSGDGGGDDDDNGETVAGMVKARVRQYANAAGGGAAGDAVTGGTADVSASSSLADGGAVDASAHPWAAPAAELVEGNKRVAQTAE
eukprot:g7223.t1